MDQKTCLIFYNRLGGEPDSREELIDSAAEERTEIPAVRGALKELGFAVKTLGVKKINSAVVKSIEEIKPDFIFNLCESLHGESLTEIYVAGLFELLRLPYTGSPPLALGIALNKLQAKEVLEFAGLAVPKAVVGQANEPIDLKKIVPPFIVKPVREDGSAGISGKSVVENLAEAEKLVKQIQEDFEEPAIIEEYIDGREFTVSILEDGSPRALAISEVDFSKLPEGRPHIISYRAKWDRKSQVYRGTEIVCPANVEADLKTQLEKISIRAFGAIGCRDYARIDIRVDKCGKPFVIEVNANPDIAPESGFEEAAKSASLTYKELIGIIAKNSLGREFRKL